MIDKFLITKIKRIIYVGKEEYKETKIVFNSNLNSNELILHLSGKCLVRFNGNELLCSDNTIRFLPKGENTDYMVERILPGDCIDIFFDTDVPISEKAFILDAKNNTKTSYLFKKIFAVWVAKNEGYYFECISLLYKIFAEMQKENYFPSDKESIIKPALEFIGENFLNGKISVPSLAEKCGISESYLKKLFVKKFGIPPVKYITQLKINYACDLLKSELYNITRVSEICGYDNLYYFSRQFKEHTGISPTQFINKYKSSK